MNELELRKTVVDQIAVKKHRIELIWKPIWCQHSATFGPPHITLILSLLPFFHITEFCFSPSKLSIQASPEVRSPRVTTIRRYDDFDFDSL